MARRSTKRKAKAPQRPSAPPVHGKLIGLQALLIIAAGLWVYWPALQGGWLWDDLLLVAKNEQLRTLGGLWNIWFAPPVYDYWPLTWTVLWIEWHLWGNHPLGYHLVSLALHLGDGFLVWRLLNRLGLRRGWLGGLLFVVYPLAVESVAWISEIKNTLSLLFFLLACDAWLDEEEGRKNHGYLRSVLYYLAAMLAKTSTIMLPFVLLLYSWWRRGTVSRRDLVRIIPYLVIAVAMGSITIHYEIRGPHAATLHAGSYPTRLTGAGMAVCFYLGKFLWPTNLLPIYPGWSSDTPALIRLLPIPLLIAFVWGLATQRKSWSRAALLGLGFFVLNLLPVVGLLTMAYQAISPVADHFIYLPMIGLIGLGVAGWEQVEKRLGRRFRPVMAGFAAVILALLAWESRGHAALFVDDETFWNYTIARNPEAWPAYDNLGVALFTQGRVDEAIADHQQALAIHPNDQSYNNLGNDLVAKGLTDQAIEAFRKALEIDPGLVAAYNDLGIALVQKGRADAAIPEFQKAIALAPGYALAHSDLGNALLHEGQVDAAISEFQKATALAPDVAEAHDNFGMALMQKGSVDAALTEFQKALEVDPANAEAHDNLGYAFLQKGETDEAITEIQKALAIKPHFAAAYNHLALALLRTGQIEEAIAQYRKALEIDPRLTEALSNLGNALMRKGSLNEAVSQYQKALLIDPNFASAHYNLGIALYQLGQLDAATAEFEEAARLNPADPAAQNALAKLRQLAAQKVPSK